MCMCACVHIVYIIYTRKKKSTIGEFLWLLLTLTYVFMHTKYTHMCNSIYKQYVYE